MRGEWIEILSYALFPFLSQSLPMRGEWIEIGRFNAFPKPSFCLSPCGESGLKSPVAGAIAHGMTGLSPCGESGLKFSMEDKERAMLDVSPHAGRVD